MFKKLMVLLLMVTALSVRAESQENPREAESIRKNIITLMQENAVPGMAVLLYVKGKPQTYYFGYANQSKKISVTKNTIFEVGSITKLMTSLLLAQEVDAAQVQLDHSVIDYLPKLSSKFEDITLGNLATHTAGLSFEVPNTIHSKANLENYLSNATPTFAVDEEWVYSNIGMGLLGDVLEKITHKKLDYLYRNRIFAPLKMTASGLFITGKNKKWIAQGYDGRGNPVKPISFELLPAGGGLKMSAADVQRFLAAAIGMPGTPEDIFYQIRMTQASYVKLSDRKQGLGWEIHSLKPNEVAMLLEEPDDMNLGPVNVETLYDTPKFNGDVLIDKTGTTDGFCAYMAVIPNRQAGIAILANGIIPHGELVNTAREILFKVTNIETEDEDAS